MEASGKLLSSRLLCLHKNGQWGKDDVVKLFKALVEQFNGRNEDFHTWITRILYQVGFNRRRKVMYCSNVCSISGLD